MAILLGIGAYSVTVLLQHRAGVGWDPAITDRVMAALSGLGLRGAEGLYDIKRQAADDIRAGDVGHG